MRNKHTIRDAVVIFGVFFALIATVAVLYIAVDVPNVSSIGDRQITQSMKIYDRTGKVLLWDINQGEKRTHIALADMSPNIRNATVAIEDSNFYKHGGFSITAIFRALIIDLLAGDLAQGGSTITQQLVKRALLVPDKTFTRKIKEVVVAIKLERVYSKDKILELYLNEIHYGTRSYGIESAAQTYFGKSARDITLSESAYLAAIPNAPTRLSPYGNHRDELDARKNLVLTRMADLGYISSSEKDVAQKEVVTFLPPQKIGILAPHFVMYVREQLSDRFGEENIERLGLSVITTLDADLQKDGEEVVKNFGGSNEKNFKASNAALVAVSAEDGGILTMVGSRDFFDLEHEGNFNVTLANRQPGSAMKPVVYAAAFTKGYTPETVVFDLSTDFAPKSDQEYRPVDFDGKTRGPVSLKTALAQSLNIPSVKVLYLTGMDTALTLARKMGITSLGDPSRYGLSLVLGGGEVSPLELTGAYSVFASGGIKHPVHAIERITNTAGEDIFTYEDTPETILDTHVVSAISNILSDHNARMPVFAANSPMNYNGRPVAVKTGTTNDYRDAWAVGYTTKIAVGTWVGNNNNTPMEKQVAGYIVAPLWRAFMDKAIARLPLEPFPAYQKTINEKPVLNGVWLGSRVFGESPNQYIPVDVHDILHWVDKDNPTGSIPTYPANDPQYDSWEGPVRSWALQQSLPSTIPYASPTTLSAPQVNIGDIVIQNTSLLVTYTISPETPISSVDIFIDGDFYRKDTSPQSTLTLPKNLFSQDTTHTIRLSFLTERGENISAEKVIATSE